MDFRKIPKLFWVVITILILLNLATLIVALRSPNGNSYPNQSIAPLNYTKVAQIIHQQLENIPVKNGVDGQSIVGPQGLSGTNGLNGVDGINGQNVTSDQIATAVSAYLQVNPPASGAQGEKGDTGLQGPAGTDASTVELQYNTVKAQIEWRYNGDTSWQVLVQTCALTNSCGP